MKNRIGILGGGQLALMLANTAVRMGIRPLILVADLNCPVALFHSQVKVGSFRDPVILADFLSRVETVIFENEFVDCQVLADAAKPFDTQFIPALPVLALYQDKLKQKELFRRLKIPSSEFCQVLSESSNEASVEAQLSELLAQWGGSLVLKWSRMGYDGHGVLFLESDPRQARSFLQKAHALKSQVYAERKVSFRRELALVCVARNSEEFGFYPLVVTEQDKGICSRVLGPSTALGVSERMEVLAQEYARKISQATGLVGTFAIEFFETDAGELWVNEVAPRVHNSGHYTQNACLTDQFENHLRAALGFPLGPISARPAFAMLNLLGPDADSLRVGAIPQPSGRVFSHGYGKSESRPRRKMGHLNGVADSVEEMNELLRELEACRNDWVKGMSDV